MLIKTYGASPVGIDAVLVTIEVHTAPGYGFTMVGLPDDAVKESYERILAALNVNGYEAPRKQITINMAPADIKKEGASYDLPLAIGMMAGGETIKTTKLSHYIIMGELSLDGSLQPIRGVLPIALCAKREGFKGIIVPIENSVEAAVVEGLEVYGMETLNEVIAFLNDQNEEVFQPIVIDTQALIDKEAYDTDDDFSDVRGQENVKRALEVAAAGGHNLIMVGPPGAGKSMMAKRIPSILPPLNIEEALETTKIHSVAGLLNRRKAHTTESLIVKRPFRSPHHSISDVGLCGGSSNPRPGEISLAHNGVLFLDELPEFKRSALEVLRQPLEDRKITITRSNISTEYPASFMFVAAMNPCPCGHYGENNLAHPCTCTPAQVHRYLSRISGPLLDRIDIHCEIAAVPYEQLKDLQPSESSSSIRERVMKARKIQKERFASMSKKTPIFCNAQMTPKMVRQFCILDEVGDKLLAKAMNSFGLSARAYDRILKVARTIADLDASPSIMPQHITEALSYRALDRDTWGM